MGIVNKDGALWMATGVDNSGLYKDLIDSEKRIDQYEAHIKKVGDNITRITGIGFGIAGLKAFGSEIINVRGEIQMLESSFDVLLGGKGVSTFMSEIKQFAVDSPLSLTGVSNAAQTLLGFNIEAEKVIPTIKQIGDISMGNEQKFQSLTLAFAQMSSTGKLMGQDLLQMINAGFNPLSVISEKTGKSIGELKKEMESGAISSEMVAQAFADATSQGGKFYGMTQKQAEGIKGLQAQLEGGLQDAFNDLGKSQEGLIAGGYKAAISLVENYEKVGKTLMALIATYGAYRAAVALNISIESGWTVSQLTHYKVLLLVEKAQKLLNATMLKNPLVLVATVAIGLVATLWALHDATTTQEKAQKRLNDIMEEAKEKKETLENKTSSLVGIINSETKTIYDQIIAYKELQGLYPNLLKNMDMQTFKAQGATKQQKMLNEALNDISKADLDATINEQEVIIKSLEKQINETMQLAALDARMQSGYMRQIDSLKEQKKITESNLESLKQQRIEEERMREEAEFLNLPEEERKVILEKQLRALEQQREYVQRQIESTGGLRSEWDKFNPLFDILNNKLRNITKQIDETRNKLVVNPEIKNKSFWENQKKEAETALEAMGESAKGSKAWEKQLQLLNQAQSKLKIWDFSGKGESAAEKARKRAQAVKEQQEQIKELINKQQKERDRSEQDLENQATQASIDAMQDGTKKKQKQRELDNKLEIQALERQKEDYIAAYIQAEREKFDAIEDLAVKEGKKKTKDIFDSSSVKVDTSKFDQIIEDTSIRQTKDQLESLLSAYQDFEAKRKEINESFSADLALLEAEKPSEEIERAKVELNKKWSEALSSLNLDELQESIDWSVVFADLDKLSVKAIKDIRTKLQAYLKDAAKTLTKEDLKTVTDAIEQMNTALSEKTPIEELKEGYEEYKKAIEDVVEAKKEQAKYEEGTEGYVNATNALTDAENKRAAGLKKTSQAANSLGQKGKELTGIGFQIVDMLESFGVEVSEDVTKTLDGVGQMFGALENVDLTRPMSIITSAIGLGTGAGKTLAGLFGLGGFMKGADYTRYNKMKEEYEALNAIWDELIDKKKEYISISYGEEAYKVGKEAEDLAKQVIENNRILGRERLNSGASKGSHSIGRRIWRDMTDEGWRQAQEALGSDWKNSYKDKSRMTWLFDLSAEQLSKLKEAGVFWTKLDDDVRGYLDSIIDGQERIEEINESVKEQLTQVSFDSVRSSFIDKLMDMRSDAADFADDFSSYSYAEGNNYIKDRRTPR